nr:uncharacterized protein LOC129451755 [Misgurnus anguillicaudatus]
MAESVSKSHVLDTSLEDKLSEILKNTKLIKGPTTRYILNTTKITEGELLRKERIGEKDDKKPHKVILLVGETGSGKSTLISAMVNYIMGVRWEHKIWLEVVETSEDQTESQTTAVTVYEVFPQDSPFSLTIIDTPGFGDTKGEGEDKLIAEALQQLFRSVDGIHEIYAVCLVLKATDARLHDRQLYIFDEILSLFGKDIEKHISILITNADENVPKKPLNLIKTSKIPCAKKKDDQPIYFKFNNCQSECYDEEDRSSYKSSWDRGNENLRQFFDYLNGLSPINVYMTEGVLRSRKQLNASVNNLKNRIEWAEGKKKELEQTKAAVKEYEQDGGNQKNYTFEVDEQYKVLVEIQSSWWHLSKRAMRCPKCEENCHYPGCWWVNSLSQCSVMNKDGKCTVCKKCEHTKHKKDNQIYERRTKKVMRTNEDLKRKYEEYTDKKSLLSKLEDSIKQADAEKSRLVEECYQCLEKLMDTALKSTSMSCFIHLDFMIEKLKETGNQERVQKLEELKRRALEENTGLIRCALKYVQSSA